MNKQFWSAGIIGSLVLGLAFVPVSYAAHGGCPYAAGGGKGDLKGKFFFKTHFLLEEQEAIGLSEDQVNTIRQLKMDVKKEVIKKSAEIEVLAVDIQSKLYEKQVDVTAINKLIDQKYEIKKALAKTLVGAFAKLKSTVSDTQWQAMKDLKKERMAKPFGMHRKL